MSRKGRELELLIHQIEKCNLPEDVDIQSPGFLKDKTTGKKREVDILITNKVGTSTIQIIIECRDRKSVQDSTWIEQLSTKAQHLGVNKVIAVSSSTFSQEAIIKANACNIETRTIGEISYDLIKSWWSVESMDMLSVTSIIHKTIIGTENDELVRDFIKGKSLKDKFINRTKDDLIFSIEDVFQSGFTNHKLGTLLSPLNPRRRETIQFNYVDENDRFTLNITGKILHILKITFDVELMLVPTKIPISSIKEYKSDDNSISHFIEYNTNDSEIGAFQFIRNTDGSMSIHIKPKGDKK